MQQKKIFGFSQNVFVLSLVSFLNDIGGETIKRAIPLYLANILGVKTTIIGLVEGIAEATPQLLQPVSGYMSDLSQRRKPLVVLGQVMRSSIVLLFWAVSWPQVLLLRVLDRSGKGIANAPRDALIAGSTSGKHKGRSFGFNRAMDNAGSVIGMLAASTLVGSALVLTRGTFQRIVLLAVVPLLLALFLQTFFLRDVRVSRRQTLKVRHMLGHRFYLFLALSFLFTLGNSSDAFLMLKAQSAGVSVSNIFLLLAAVSLVASITGLPLSSLSDRIGRKRLLVTGWVLYAVVYYQFAASALPAGIANAFLLYGLYYGLTEGSAKALIADVVPKERRGSAFGLYNMVVGATLFPASLIAGWLWQTFSPSAAFAFGSAMAVVSSIGLLVLL